jgi:hypothetical protein
MIRFLGLACDLRGGSCDEGTELVAVVIVASALGLSIWWLWRQR